MKGLWLLLAGCLLFGVTVGAQGQDKKADNKEKLVGVWELAKGDGPPGATLEFTKDGKVKMAAKVKEKDKVKDITLEGTYKVEGDKLMTVVKFDGKELKETHTIKTLTDKMLVTMDEKGQTDEFKKVK